MSPVDSCRTDGKKGYFMPISVRGTKSRDELIAELKEVRAASVRVQGDDVSLEFELGSMTEQLKGLCAQRAQSIEAERASWLPWSPGLRGGPVGHRSTRPSPPPQVRHRPKDSMRKYFTGGFGGRARNKAHEGHFVLRRPADRAALDAWQNEGGAGGGAGGAARIEPEPVDNRAENDDRSSNGQGIDARGAQ
jgi:hypothetical protein